MKPKKLEWQKTIDGDFEAEAFEGVYCANHLYENNWVLCWAFGRSVRTIKNPATGNRSFANIDAATQTAQTDFETLVKACYKKNEVPHG